MLKRSFLIIGIAGCLFLGACGRAATRVTAVRDNAAPARTYHKVVVFVPFKDLESRMKAEHAFAKRLSNKGVEVIESLTLFPPTRSFSEADYERIVRETGADGALLVTLTDSEVRRVYVPRSSTTQGQATVEGDTVTYSGRTQEYGGYYLHKPVVYYQLELIDVASGKSTWFATSRTGGNAFASFNTLVNSLANTSVEKLRKDGLIESQK